MKTGITKQYDGNFPERNLVSNQEQGAQLPQFSQYLVDEINGYQHIRDGWIEGSKDYEVYDLMVRVLRKAADKYIELESYRTQSTEVKTQGAEELLEALQKIQNPVAYLQNSLKEGERLDGVMAVALSNDANWLKEIARKAIDSYKSSPSHTQPESAGIAP